ncbi:MAG TPA: PLD nuclease N-terminal domain-containing protein [Capsulimonadaceae bacterium]|jgi:hypothetical protein
MDDGEQLFRTMTAGMAALAIVYVILAIAQVSLMAWALVDLWRRPFREQSAKPLWLIAIIAVPLLGSLIYLTMGRKSA